MTIRKAGPEDMPFIRQVSREAYGDGFFDTPASDKWVLGLMLSPTALVMRGDRAWTASAVSSFPWAPSELNGALLVAASIGSGHGELVSMVRQAIDWAKKCGAGRYFLSASTGVDFGPLAKRIGAQQVSPNYVLELSHG